MDSANAPARIEHLLAHREWVRRLARSLVLDEGRAADLEQQVWLSALERPPVHVDAPRGWLATALRHAASNLRRGEARRGRHEEAAARREPQPATVDLVAEAEAQRRVVDEVIALEEPYRATVLLRWFEDLDPVEIARRQGVPLETVRTRLRRALQQLRERLDRGSGGERRAWVLALLPLARRAEDAAPTITGGALMTLKAKAGIAAAVLLLVGWITWGSSRPVPAPPPAETPPPVAAAKPPEPEPESPPAPAKPIEVPTSPTPPPPPEEIRGRVLAADGAPLEGAVVFLGEQVLARGDEPFKPFDERRVPQAVRTGSDGGFTLRGEGRVVTAWHPAHSPVTVPVASCAEVRLLPRGALRGRLLVTGSGVEVALDRVRKASTDAEGRFAFEGVEAGVRGLLLPGRRYIAVRVAPGSPTEVEIGPGLPEVRLEIRSAGKLLAEPVFGVLVGLGSPGSVHEVKSADGTCALPGVLPGGFLFLSGTGHLGMVDISSAAATLDLGPATLAVRGVPGTSVCLAPGEPDFLVDLFAMRVGHRPIPASGALTFPGLADGDYRVLTESPAGSGRKASEAPVTVAGGKDADLDLRGR